MIDQKIGEKISSAMCLIEEAIKNEGIESGEKDLVKEIQMVILERAYYNLSAIQRLRNDLGGDPYWAIPIFNLLRPCISDFKTYQSWVSMAKKFPNKSESSIIKESLQKEIKEIVFDINNEVKEKQRGKCFKKIETMLNKYHYKIEIGDNQNRKQKSSLIHKCSLKKVLTSSFRFISKYFHLNPLTIELHNWLYMDPKLTEKIDFEIGLMVNCAISMINKEQPSN